MPELSPQILNALADVASGYQPDWPPGRPPEDVSKLSSRISELRGQAERDWTRAGPIDPRTLIRQAVLELKMDQPQALIRALIRHLPEDADIPSLAQLRPNLQPIQWLWPSWIPRGMLSLLGASPGSGKSLVALDLARRVIHGEPFPDGAPIPTPRRAVIYVDAESVPQIQAERAEAWHMDDTHLYLMLPDNSYAMIDLSDPDQQDRLIHICDVTAPELIIIDSLSAVSSRGENNVEDVRALLGFLTNLAREHNAGVLLIHHLRKRQSLPTMDLVGPDDFRGSGHIIAMARSVLALSVIQANEEPDRNGPRRLEVIKTNLCRYPKPLGLILEPGDPRAPTLRYTDQPAAAYQAATEAEECADWLLSHLAAAAEPVRAHDAMAAAREAGFSERTIYRTRKQLAGTIVDTEPRRSPYNCWKLAAEESDEPTG